MTATPPGHATPSSSLAIHTPPDAITTNAISSLFPQEVAP
ncbi:hypothetical protein BH23DEI1_BH23DEI1_17110 [soil metagenome]